MHVYLVVTCMHVRMRAPCASPEREREKEASATQRGGIRRGFNCFALYKLREFSNWSTAGVGRSVFKWTDAPVEVEFADGSARDGKLDPVKRFIAQHAGG